MPKKLTPAFSAEFDAPIWKSAVSSSASRLYLELRDARQHRVQFAALELPSGRLLWTSLTLDEPWWVTLALAGERYLLLQSFTDTNDPSKKKYYAIDTATRQLVWQSDQFQILNLANNWLLGYREQELTRDYVQIQLPTGEISEGDYSQKKPERENKDFYQPFFYSENQPYFTTVADFVESLELGRPVGGCEYLEYRSYVCIAYYVPKSTELANYLLVIDQNGSILLHQCLETSVPKPTLGTFFISRDQLIVVQHKLQLASYAIP